MAKVSSRNVPLSSVTNSVPADFRARTSHSVLKIFASVMEESEILFEFTFLKSPVKLHL